MRLAAQPAAPPYDNVISEIVVQTIADHVATIRVQDHSSLVIEGSREALNVLAENAIEMPDLAIGDHCHVDSLILSGYLTTDSVFSVWERC